jgi:hypothetical protein
MTAAVEEAFTEELAAHATYQIVSGNPDTVIKKPKHIIDLVDPGYMILWGGEGRMSHTVAMRTIDLLSQEVPPSLRTTRLTGSRGGQAESVRGGLSEA